jgi:hypothetical protein
MLSSVDYATLLQYSPRGKSKPSKDSRKVRDTIKGGRLAPYRIRISEIIAEHKGKLHPFLNSEVTLVPAPRSSITREGDLIPALEICKLLASLNLGIIAPCLFRREAIRKSAFCKPEDRPSVPEHYQSMEVENYFPTIDITLVDDVLTMGRTSIAGASRLAEKFPNATIRIFALMRTMGLVSEIENILSVTVGTLNYNSETGYIDRLP